MQSIATDFTPYAPSVPFERLAGPYLMAQDSAGLLLGFQTKACHANAAGQVHPAAIMAFGDFALYALINHHSGGAYANRVPSDEETIVTLSADTELLSSIAVGETLVARGYIARESRRMFIVRTIISTSNGKLVARMGGLWSKTIVPAQSGVALPKPADAPSEMASSFRSLLAMDKLPLVISAQHCNDLAILHGGCTLAVAAYAMEDALQQNGRMRPLVSMHADFFAPGRAGQSVGANITLTPGQSGVIHAEGTVRADDKQLMAFHAISCE